MQTELHIQPEHALVLCIVGPTGSGKTHLAMRLAEQAKSQGKGIEIISMDSALVYRGLDIGSAKPTLTERTAVTVGGTMLYWRAWAFGLSSLPPANPEIRARLDEEGKQFGWPTMHQKLALIDPITAQRLEPNDSQRVQRALEVYEATGKSMSAWLADAPSEDGREGSSIPSWITLVSLEPGDRAKLHALLEKRFDHMLEQGFMQEVEGLRKNSALHADLPAIRSVGYRQAWEHLDGKITWDEMRYKSLAATRQLGKRQLTWLRAIAGRKVFDSFNPKELEAALAYCQETLKI